MSAYGWVILCSFIGPLALSFDQKVAFYKVWRYLIPSILIVGIGFLLWDEVFTRMGVWGFNPRYLFGVYLGRLPLEEVLFFLVVPYNFIFILLVLQAYFPNRKTEMIQRIFTWTMGISSLLMVLFYGGGQLFFACYKNNYLKLDEVTYHPPQMWCSDDDIHLRFILKGFDKVVSSACIYHFVSKTSRTGEYKEGEIVSNKNFLKKWGFRKSHYNVVYDKKLISNVVLDDETKEVLECFFNGGDDIIVEINNNFNGDDYSYIQQLNDIVKQTNDIGTFELGNLTITVNSLEEQQNKYIIL
jgi:lycopene cyclase domain-containing protein